MKLIFFDEAKDDDAHPHYHIGAICIDEGDLREVEERIAGIAQETFGSALLSRDTELHAAEIYHRKGLFKHWSDFERRAAILESLIDVLNMETVQLIDIQINADRLYGSQSADEIAFMFLCERANDLVRSSGAMGMLIGDRESDRVAERFATSLSGYRAAGTDFEFGRDIHHLVDSVHFTHSHLSKFLQLADVYTWLLQFQCRNRESDDFRHRRVLDALARDGVNLFPAKYKEWPQS